jgi:putative protein kinase ArgK-like GTPase of G3E family
MRVFEVSAKTGQGMQEVAEFVRDRLEAARESLSQQTVPS